VKVKTITVSPADHRRERLLSIAQEANRILGSSYSLDGRERLETLEKEAIDLCRKGDRPGQYRTLDDLEPYEIRIHAHLRYERERFARTAGDKDQPYLQDMVLSPGDFVPVGFHKAYRREKNLAIAGKLNYRTVFPHYCISYYDLRSGKPVEKNIDAGPEVFQVPDCYNFGEASFFTIWGESMIFMGWPEFILRDIEMLVQSAEDIRVFRTGNDMIADLGDLGRKINGASIDYHDLLNGMRHTFIELRSVTDHQIFLLAIDNFPVSIVLSPGARENIQCQAAEFLTPMVQVPFGMCGYRRILEQDYGYREQRVATLTLMNRPFPMFAVRPGLYGHKSRVIYNAKTGMITGKISNIKKFFLELRRRELLAGNDVWYFTVL
jgi:hypothetical protein